MHLFFLFLTFCFPYILFIQRASLLLDIIYHIHIVKDAIYIKVWDKSISGVTSKDLHSKDLHSKGLHSKDLIDIRPTTQKTYTDKRPTTQKTYTQKTYTDIRPTLTKDLHS